MQHNNNNKYNESAGSKLVLYKITAHLLKCLVPSSLNRLKGERTSSDVKHKPEVSLSVIAKRYHSLQILFLVFAPVLFLMEEFDIMTNSNI